MYFQKSKKKRQRSVSVHLPKERAGGGNSVRGKYLRCFLVVTLLLVSARFTYNRAPRVSLAAKKRSRWANQFWVETKRPVAAVHVLSKPLKELPCRELPQQSFHQTTFSLFFFSLGSDGSLR